MRRRQVMAWGATAALVLIGGAGWFTTSELQRIHAEGNGGGGLHLKLPEPDSRAGARHGSTTFRRSHSPPQSTTPPTAGTLDHMMYWDRRAGSPIRAGSKEWAPATRQGKYLLMCVDQGGFNNIRLQFETIVALAFVMGRTLVLPPNRRWYLLGNRELNYADFFDMNDLEKLVPIISRADYENLSKEGTTHQILRLNTLKDTVAFPSVEAVRAAVDPDVLKRGIEQRVLVDAAPGRAGTNNYLHDTDALEVTNGAYRMLATWHTFLFFADPNHDRELKRLMRDHVHYRRDIYEAAAAGVDQMGGLGNYTSLHIRRGDFQYLETRIGAAEIFKNVAPLLKRSGQKRLYISTDEHNAAFFEPFRAAGYEVTLWRMLKVSQNELPFEWIGLVEQLVAAGSNMFVGTRLSTFSSYIMRVHNYIPQLANKELLYCDRRYTGDADADSNEKSIDLTNTALGGGELFYFREPRIVWNLD